MDLLGKTIVANLSNLKNSSSKIKTKKIMSRIVNFFLGIIQSFSIYKSVLIFFLKKLIMFLYLFFIILIWIILIWMSLN